ncbi:hypothetical protein [Acetobacter peroxydans]|nr:hypothetical protein [Acetobacter peroxydans]
MPADKACNTFSIEAGQMIHRTNGEVQRVDLKVIAARSALP